MYYDDPKVAFDEKTLLEEKWLNDSLYTNIALKHYPVRGLLWEERGKAIY